MLLKTIAVTFGLSFATSTYARSVAINNSQLKSEVENPNYYNQTFQYLPEPRPDQTIGDYFDTLLSLNNTSLKPRHIQRTPTLTEATWSDGTADYNISMSRCLHITDNVGIYTTSQNITLADATLADIITDLHTRKPTKSETRRAYAARVQENARLAIDEVTALLQPPLTSPEPTIATPTHDEFRRLLAPLSAYMALILRATTVAETTVAFFTGLTGRMTGYVPESGVISVAITSYGLNIAHGLRHLTVVRDPNADPGIAFITATIANAFLAWLRAMARVFAGEWLLDASQVLPLLVSPNGVGRNRTLGPGPVQGENRGPLKWPVSPDMLKTAIGRLGELDDPAARFVALARVETQRGCQSGG